MATEGKSNWIIPGKGIRQIKEIRQLRYILPKSQRVKTKLLQPSGMQSRLIEMKIQLKVDRQLHKTGKRIKSGRLERGPDIYSIESNQI